VNDDYYRPSQASAPAIASVAGPAGPVAKGSAAAVTGTFNGSGAASSYTATWDWGDGTTSGGAVILNGGTGTVTGNHPYTAAGVYRVKLKVSGPTGWTEMTYRFVVVYDPAAGFVTGGGWINSPAGAYAAVPTLVGRATFGFVSKIPEGRNHPDRADAVRVQGRRPQLPQ